ncbi:hypothetical protein C7N83_08500 [Neisseria iguanae]|uniref:Uncharacterized protein n=2 Tax=Neisseria iguanae TaxID=90242 RepID=A0A2P7TZA0_9NEIS|nr:hypothetical protein C7N83_08500 [Neisseria iguanae]
MADSKRSTQDIPATRMAEISERNQGLLFDQPEISGNQNKVAVQSRLSLRRHPTADFFVIDVFDAAL